MKTFLIILIVLFILSFVFVGFLMFCTWVLSNKKNTKLYNWVNKYIVTETDLEI